jgi:hypothetical protein
MAATRSLNLRVEGSIPSRLTTFVRLLQPNYSLTLCRKERVDLAGCFLLKRRKDVRVGVHRQADLRVPQRPPSRSWGGRPVPAAARHRYAADHECGSSAVQHSEEWRGTLGARSALEDITERRRTETALHQVSTELARLRRELPH